MPAVEIGVDRLSDQPDVDPPMRIVRVVAKTGERDPIITTVECRQIAAEVIVLDLGLLIEMLPLDIAPRQVRPGAGRRPARDLLFDGELRAAHAEMKAVRVPIRIRPPVEPVAGNPTAALRTPTFLAPIIRQHKN